MSDYKYVVESFLEQKEAKNELCPTHMGKHYVDESIIIASNTIIYELHGHSIAAIEKRRVGDTLILMRILSVLKEAHARFMEFSKILRERYGIEVEFMLFSIGNDAFDMAYKYNGNTYRFISSVEINLVRKTLKCPVIQNPRVYLANDPRVNTVFEYDAGNDFVIAIGTVNSEPVIKLSRYNAKYIEMLDHMGKHYLLPLIVYWVPVKEHFNAIALGLSVVGGIVGRNVVNEVVLLLKMLDFI